MSKITLTFHDLSIEQASEVVDFMQTMGAGAQATAKVEKPAAVKKPAKQAEPEAEDDSLDDFASSPAKISDEELLEAAGTFISKFSDAKEGRSEVKKLLKKFDVNQMSAIAAEDREEAMRFLKSKNKK